MEDIREGIAKIEFVRDDFTFAEGGRFNFTKAGIIKLLTYLKANRVVRLSENQELPKIPVFAVTYPDDLLKANFKRVEELI